MTTVKAAKLDWWKKSTWNVWKRGMQYIRYLVRVKDCDVIYGEETVS